ncbi:hypothetical protein AB1K54_15700 [Microbacterium sp. BWT-B31]|uniref:hypothetical protein n=1 Tax=Microbacterium sp. BWT-B31 TaxID=3232072 RepID=UPI0035280D6C
MNPDFPRDLVFIGALFGVAAFVWAGWAQESPPRSVWWRILLGALSLAGLVLAALTTPVLIANWGEPTAIDPGSGAFITYIVVFWVELIACAVLAYFAIRARLNDLVSPLVLVVVGIHFFALAPVLAQPALFIPAVLLTLVAVVAFAMPASDVARSFWCGVVGAPVFLAMGAWAAVVGTAALGSG